MKTTATPICPDLRKKNGKFMEKNIGIFDSGIGGLTVVKSIKEAMPQENIIYFGDTAHVPYGTRSREQITQYVLSDVEFLTRFDLKAVVIACNTADSIARQKVEELYPDMPVFGVVEPAAIKAAKYGKIGIIATNATVHSGAYERSIRAINPGAEVISVACPLLVPLVENNRYKKDDKVIETVLREYLEPLKEKNIDCLVLGCTHYPLLRDIIEYIMPGIEIISSSDEAAKTLKYGLEKRGLLLESDKKGDSRYYVSDNPEGFIKSADTFLGGVIDASAVMKA